MNIYKITRLDDGGWDTFDSAVVITKDENDAQHFQMPYGWVSPELVKVEFIGVAKEGSQHSLVLGSFNAG